MLVTYHEDSVTRLNEASSENRLNTEAVRKQLKNSRQEFHYKLKPSHGHPRNAWRLESLMSNFQLFNSECAETLSTTCDRIVVSGLFLATCLHPISTICHVMSIIVMSYLNCFLRSISKKFPKITRQCVQKTF